MHQIEIYFQELLSIKQQAQSLNHFELNEFWLTKHSELKKLIHEQSLEELPKIMTLISREFLFDKNGVSIEKAVSHSPSFTSVHDADNCQISLLTDDISNCEFNNHSNLRGKCQADHIFPHSFGGPAIIENRAILCRYHNVAKSNSIMHSFWSKYPTWINTHINSMLSLKH